MQGAPFAPAILPAFCRGLFAVTTAPTKKRVRRNAVIEIDLCACNGLDIVERVEEKVREKISMYTTDEADEA